MMISKHRTPLSIAWRSWVQLSVTCGAFQERKCFDDICVKSAPALRQTLSYSRQCAASSQGCVGESFRTSGIKISIVGFNIRAICRLACLGNVGRKWRFLSHLARRERSKSDRRSTVMWRVCFCGFGGF